MVLLVPLLILLSACGNGVSHEEFDAEQARVQGQEVQVQALQQRLDKAATITEVLDTLTSSFEEGPSGDSILQVTALLHTASESELHDKWHELADSLGGDARHRGY